MVFVSNQSFECSLYSACISLHTSTLFSVLFFCVPFRLSFDVPNTVNSKEKCGLLVLLSSGNEVCLFVCFACFAWAPCFCSAFFFILFFFFFTKFYLIAISSLCFYCHCRNMRGLHQQKSGGVWFLQSLSSCSFTFCYWLLVLQIKAHTLTIFAAIICNVTCGGQELE